VKRKFLLFNNLNISNELREDLNRVAWGVSIGFVFFVCLYGAPFAGFVRALGVGDFMYGVLMGLPVMSGLFQLLAAYVLERTGNRKKLFIIGGILQRVSIIPVVILPLIVPDQLKGAMIGLIVFFLLCSAIGGSFNTVTYMSWMAALVPLRIRGRFFSQRHMMFTFTGMIGGLLASFVLDRIDGFIGFTLVFCVVTVFALVDLACFIGVQDPPMIKPKQKISLHKMWKEVFKHSNFRRYLIFWSLWVFGISVSGPFFTAYMLEYLEMSYFEISIYTQTVYNIVTIIFVRKWGELIDRFGNKPVLRICGTVAAFLPLFWLLAKPSNYMIIPFIHALSGMFWCGTELTTNNLVMELSPDENRSFYIASFSMITSVVGSILAYSIGGLFMQFTKGWIEKFNIVFLGQPLSNYHALFVIASFIRFIAITFLVSPIHEEKSIEPKEMLRHSIQAVGNHKKIRE
jgi:MFS family permease